MKFYEIIIVVEDFEAVKKLVDELVDYLQYDEVKNVKINIIGGR